MSQLVIYEDHDRGVEIRLEGESLWMSQRHMAELFDTTADNIGLHLRNIFQSNELEEIATTEDFSVVQIEGKREVSRRVKHYNLDAVISVGYRVNSAQATRFRIWATRVLKDHLNQGWTLNRQRLEANARELEAALKLVRKTARHPDLELEAGQAGGNLPGIEEARVNIASLKQDLIQRQEAQISLPRNVRMG